MLLPETLFTDIKDLLLPHITTVDDREALLIEAFYLLPDSRLYHQIQREGTPQVFCMKCLKDLKVHGCVSDHKHSISRLLEVLRGYYGTQQQAQIDALIPQFNQLCGQPAAEAAIPTPAPTPPAEPLQSIQTPLAQRTATVFVSYSHRDTPMAQRLLHDLQAQGHACWIDLAGIKGGDEWMQSIRDGINNSYAFVILCTHQALASRWVRDEILWARQKEKLIIPLLLEDVTKDDNFFGLHTYQGIFMQDYALALAQLLQVLPSPQFTQREPTRAPALKVVTRRQLELDYLERLRFSDFRLEQFELAEYAALSGVAQPQRKAQDAWEMLAMQQEFALIRQKLTEQTEQDTPSEPFTDAVSKITELWRVVVLGEPGAGKTHTLRAIAKPLYTAALNDPGAPLPLLVKLGNWDQADQPFEAFLRATLGELGHYLAELLATGRARLLLDGLNEFPADQRKTKYPQVEAFIQRYPEVMAVVTCRAADYPISLHLQQVLIRPLDPLRIRDFARRVLRKFETDDAFFWKLVGAEARRFEARFQVLLADKLPDWESVFWLADTLPAGLEWQQEFINTFYYGWERWLSLRDQPASILTLARNPYLLRMLLDVYIQFKGALPSNRGQLFQQFVNYLLYREKLATEEKTTLTITRTAEGEQLVSGLQRLAFEMQVRRREKVGSRDLGAGTALDQATVRTLLDERLLYLAGSTSLLNVSAEVRFTHQLLQEYFAALYMQTEIASGRLKAVDIWQPERWWERTNWEEATILLAGLYSDNCTPILDWVADANPEVAAQCIARSGAQTPDSTLLKLRDQWLPRLTDLQRDPSPLTRAAVGRALGQVKLSDGTLLDDRSGVGLRPDGLPDIEWVEIPAGEFHYGHADERDNLPQVVILPTFHMAKYLVTYAQFQSFIDAADGFRNPQWWMGLAADDQHKAGPGDQAFKFWNHPRERVSWYDAVAFCRWLSAKLGVEVRLPTEYEWEKAARGTDGRIYPYGNEFDVMKDNVHETGISQTSAVGVFPDGASPYGVLDMSGNVWEWCLSAYADTKLNPAEEQTNNTHSRVLRAGSWYYHLNDAHAASRNLNSPDNRSYYYGFRVLRPSSQ
jgi:formylglycine-generating enzyme required for sulfatase activity